MHPNALHGVRTAIRRFLVLDEDDPIDLVLLASILANFDPQREVPIWLVIVGQPASAKTELISLVQGWQHVWPLPDDLSGSTFQSSRTGKRSLLERIKSSKARILFCQDMGSLMDLHRNVAGQIYQQLRGIHDGQLLKETGYNSEPLGYGIIEHVAGRDEPQISAIPPADRLGWIGAATTEFHGWQNAHSRLGSRFTAYLWLPHGVDDYEKLAEIDRRRAEKAHWRTAAAQQVTSFLDKAVAEMDDFPKVRVTEGQRASIAAAAKLVAFITGTSRVSDTGGRLQPRISSMVRMLAFMAGRSEPNGADMAIGREIALSQLRHPDQQQIVRFALDPERIGSPWTIKELTRHTALVRRVFERTLDDLSDVGVLEVKAKAGFQGKHFYTASARLQRLASAAFPPEVVR